MGSGWPRDKRPVNRTLCVPLGHRKYMLFTCLTCRLSRGQPPFRKVYVLKVYVPFSCLNNAVYGGAPKERRRRRAEKRLSKRVFLESPFLLCPLKVFRTFQVFLKTNLKGAEKKRTLSKTPFWTTVSPHDAFAAPLAHSECSSSQTMWSCPSSIQDSH